MTERTELERLSIGDVAFDDRGLVPAVVQDHRSGEVLMLAYMNRESLSRTVESGETWFYSRSRQTLWNKGATSGNRQLVKWIRIDCDADTLLVGVEQLGVGACHVEPNITCFWRGLEGVEPTHAQSFDVLAELARVIEDRQRTLPEGSYTTTLFQRGIDRVAQKVGEEAVEVILAAKNHVDSPGPELACEVADLLYHLMVMARVVDLDITEVFQELSKRRGKTP